MKSITNHLLILALLAVFGLGACNPKKQAASNIEELEKKLYADTTQTINKEAANAMVIAYIDFTDNYPEDKKTPEYLFKAAEIAMGLMKSNDAIQYLEKVCKDYPDYEKTPAGLFLQGFIYETQFRNNVMAQKIYLQFIKQYPNHTLTDDAEFSLKNLGKSDEEIIKEFEEKLAEENKEM